MNTATIIFNDHCSITFEQFCNSLKKFNTGTMPISKRVLYLVIIREYLGKLGNPPRTQFFIQHGIEEKLAEEYEKMVDCWLQNGGDYQSLLINEILFAIAMQD